MKGAVIVGPWYTLASWGEGVVPNEKLMTVLQNPNVGLTRFPVPGSLTMKESHD